jgi:hypothetical protein
MAKANRAGLPLGTLFEYRIGRLRFCQGYFVRRSIDIWPVRLEGDKLAELDLLAVVFDPQLRRSVEIVECKTGQGGEGEVDRVVWLRGLAPLNSARTLTFAKLRVAERTGTSLGALESMCSTRRLSPAPRTRSASRRTCI